MSLEPRRITLADVSSLKPHEQSIQHAVDKLAHEIKTSGRIIHPVVVDAKTGLVVDGTHRVEAARQLGLRYIPVYRVDYLSESVVLDGWGRVLRREAVPEKVFQTALDEGFKPVEAETQETALCFVENSGRKTCFALDEPDLLRLYDRISGLERLLSVHDVSYVPEPELSYTLRSGGFRMGYTIRRLRKAEVLNVVEKGFRLPPKSTRHLVDRRPMFVLCPLELLGEDDAERLFEEWLEKGVWVDLGSGVVIDRRYDEKILLYFRQDLRSLYPENVLKLLEAVKV
ncbi:MAG: ParB N-terminal domain-containing protein [Candidatus Caldarchaeum sp.]